MGIESMSVGLGASFSVNARTAAMDRMFDGIRSGVLNLVHPDSAHITIVDTNEVEIPIYSPETNETVDDATVEITRFMLGIPIREIVLNPRGHKLESFGRTMAVPIARHQVLTNARKGLTEIIGDLTGATLGSRDFEPHFSVGYFYSGASKADRKSRRFGNPRSPGDIHLDGFSVHEKEHKVVRTAKQTYANRPLGLRHK